jgi:hypothetical protein
MMRLSEISLVSVKASVLILREITLAEKCIYHDDFDGALYHGYKAEVMHRSLKEIEG